MCHTETCLLALTREMSFSVDGLPRSHHTHFLIIIHANYILGNNNIIVVITYYQTDSEAYHQTIVYSALRTPINAYPLSPNVSRDLFSEIITELPTLKPITHGKVVIQALFI